MRITKKILWVVGCALVVFVAHKMATAQRPIVPNFNNAQVKQIQQVVRSYLVENPKILEEAMQNLHEQKAKQEQNKLAKIQENIAKNKEQIFNPKAPGRVVNGNNDPAVIVVEFTQHQCPGCRRATPIVNRAVKSNPQTQLITIFWPFFGNDAIYAAKAVIAAQNQHQAAQLDSALSNQNGSISKEKIDSVIKSISAIDIKKLYSDMNSQAIDQGLKENLKLGEKLGLVGTPAVIVADKNLTTFKLIPGLTFNFEKDLSDAIKDAGNRSKTDQNKNTQPT